MILNDQQHKDGQLIMDIPSDFKHKNFKHMKIVIIQIKI
jgi:hypothetical protein